MAGPFTRFLIADAAKRRRSILGALLYKILNKHSEFLYLVYSIYLQSTNMWYRLGKKQGLGR